MKFFILFPDKPFVTNTNLYPWWSVDLLTKVEVHVIRIITAVGYRPADLKGLAITIGKAILACEQALLFRQAK